MCYSGVVQVMIFCAVAITFSTSHKAGLNPGIALTIWSIIPFLAAIADRVLY